MKQWINTVFAASLLALPAVGHAQVLKCIGKDGKVEFASSCPPGTKQQPTTVSSKPAAPAATGNASKETAAPKSTADREAEFRKRQAEQQEANAKGEKTAAENQQRQQACQNAQSHLRVLQERQRTYRIDPKTGERVFYEEADYLRDIPVAERQIAENCKS